MSKINQQNTMTSICPLLGTKRTSKMNYIIKFGLTCTSRHVLHYSKINKEN
jgi:hypothetical protein